MGIAVSIIRKPPSSRISYPPDLPGYITVVFTDDLRDFMLFLSQQESSPALFVGNTAPIINGEPAGEFVYGGLVFDSEGDDVYLQTGPDPVANSIHVYQQDSWLYTNAFYIEYTEDNLEMAQMLAGEFPGFDGVVVTYFSGEDIDTTAYDYNWEALDELSFTGMTDKTWNVDVLVRFDYDDGGGDVVL